MQNHIDHQQRHYRIKQFVEYTMRSRWHAVLIAVIALLLPFFSWLGTVILCLVTLREGAKEGLLVLLGISLVTIAVGMIAQSALLIQYTLISYLLAWLLANVLRITISWSRTLEVAIFLGLVAVMIVHWSIADIQQHWLVLFNLLLARWGQALLCNPGGLGKELRGLRLSWLTHVILLAIVGSVLVHVVMAYDMLPVIVLGFSLAGLSLMHFLANLGKMAWLFLFGFYTVLILFFFYALSVLIVLAMVDTYWNMRSLVKQKYFANGDNAP